MTDHALTEPARPAPDAPARVSAEPPAGLIAGMFLLLASRRRSRDTRTLRGFDRHQLRDLGISPFDLW